ncbi:hypothetical protein DSO57_1000031 [Entomophthora muscae]|uniref:Uncharacterized protein n=1 Tax=Entomophthora muscae TaxID=34485 RepID=A0ACC2SM57_9FUNG|nr:hypothetical protein DSO57_1000031 [Entomophthora muscae]
MHQSIPDYVRERLHEFHQLEQPWRTQVDSTLNTYLINFEQLVKQINKFSAYSFDQLQQVAALAAKGLCKLGKEFDQERAATAATIAKLQTQVNELSTSKLNALPSPPSDDLEDREQRLWDAIQELKASTCSQDHPTKAPQQDPQVLALTTQIADLQQDVTTLREMMVSAVSPTGVTDKDGCCPGVGFLSISPQSVSWLVARDRLEGIVIL